MNISFMVSKYIFNIKPAQLQNNVKCVYFSTTQAIPVT